MALALPLLAPAGVRLELDGSCNRCGLCCVRTINGRRVVCEYLKAAVPPRPLGHPEASRCQVYEYRTPLRPLRIRLLDAQGTVQQVATCFKDTWEEDQVIAEEGLGRGCSLTLRVHQGRLTQFKESER